jgi:hypothetical protein
MTDTSNEDRKAAGECMDCVGGECVAESGGGYRAPNCPHLKDVKVEVPSRWQGFCAFKMHAAWVHEVRAGGRTFIVCDDCEGLLLKGRAGRDRPRRCAIITKDSAGNDRIE